MCDVALHAWDSRVGALVTRQINAIRHSEIVHGSSCCLSLKYNHPSAMFVMHISLHRQRQPARRRGYTPIIDALGGPPTAGLLHRNHSTETPVECDAMQQMVRTARLAIAKGCIAHNALPPIIVTLSSSLKYKVAAQSLQATGFRFNSTVGAFCGHCADALEEIHDTPMPTKSTRSRVDFTRLNLQAYTMVMNTLFSQASARYPGEHATVPIAANAPQQDGCVHMTRIPCPKPDSLEHEVLLLSVFIHKECDSWYDQCALERNVIDTVHSVLMSIPVREMRSRRISLLIAVNPNAANNAGMVNRVCDALGESSHPHVYTSARGNSLYVKRLRETPCVFDGLPFAKLSVF